MEFCPKCGSVLEEKRKNFGCVRCGYVAKGKIKIESSENIKESQEVGVVKEKDTDVFPVVSFNCEKCGNKKAYFWTAQTRAADESETRFFKCTKCKVTVREYK
jgi:transcription factor S